MIKLSEVKAITGGLNYNSTRVLVGSIESLPSDTAVSIAVIMGNVECRSYTIYMSFNVNPDTPVSEIRIRRALYADCSIQVKFDEDYDLLLDMMKHANIRPSCMSTAGEIRSVFYKYMILIDEKTRIRFHYPDTIIDEKEWFPKSYMLTDCKPFASKYIKELYSILECHDMDLIINDDGLKYLTDYSDRSNIYNILFAIYKRFFDKTDMTFNFEENTPYINDVARFISDQYEMWYSTNDDVEAIARDNIFAILSGNSDYDLTEVPVPVRIRNFDILPDNDRHILIEELYNQIEYEFFYNESYTKLDDLINKYTKALESTNNDIHSTDALKLIIAKHGSIEDLYFCPGDVSTQDEVIKEYLELLGIA